MEVEEFIKFINTHNIKSINYIDDEFYNEDIDIDEEGIVRIDDNVDPVNFRWFQEASDVYKIGDRYVEVRGPSILFGEGDFDDLSNSCEAYEVELIPTTKYEYRKKV